MKHLFQNFPEILLVDATFNAANGLVCTFITWYDFGHGGVVTTEEDVSHIKKK